jgi:D-serine deaminase-like pyridoxal phosphate-dependent protein
MATLWTIPTPALVVDAEKLDRNIAAMSERINGLGVPLRPHVKTCKSVDIARRMVRGQPGGITVSTLKEADYFFDAGFRDVTYAVPLAPGKFEHVTGLIRRGADLKVLITDAQVATALAQHAQGQGVVVPALIEVSSDGSRTGVAPESAALLELGRLLAGTAGTRLLGVLTHGGGAYGCKSTDELRAWAERERAGAVRAAARLREAGLDCAVVSIGSTPTATFATRLDGVTEVRVGVYVFQDLHQAALGVCDLDAIALTVVAEVVDRSAAKRRIYLDAGALALSKDRSTASTREDLGYGLAFRLDAGPADADLVVREVSQEHGHVDGRHAPLDVERYRVGERVRILPNHSCITAAGYDHYHVANAAGDIVGTWPRVNGW